MQKRWWYDRLWYLLFLVPLIYRPILGIALIFFLPGLGFVLNLFKKTRTHEKIALSIALSIALVVLNGFFLNTTFGLNFATVFTSLLLVTVIPLIVYFKRTGLENIQLKKPTRQQILQVMMLVLCLSVLAFKVYKPHTDNPYPIHLDEWSRLLETTHIIEEETFNHRFNPQFVGHPPAPRRLNPGFQFILSQFYIVSGVDQISFFQYLPALFALMTGFIIFSFLFKISNYWTGLFAIVFLSFLKTNDNTLGISFLVALTMTFPLLYALFYALHNSFKEKESLYLLLAAFLYFTVLVTHEQTGAAFLPIVAAYFIVNLALLKTKKEKLKISKKGVIICIVSFILPLLSLYVAREIIWKGSFAKSFNFLLSLIVWKGISPIRYSYNFVVFYGVVLALLAVIGAVMVYKNKDMGVFLIWSLIAVGQVMNFYFNQVTYFSALERIRHHAVLGLVPLSAYGLYSLLNFLSKKLKQHNEEVFSIVSVAVIFFASMVSVAYVDTGKYLPDNKQPQHYLTMAPTIDYKD
ncbi:DUF1616 domain-containing protein, partial [Candidatus Woesearchaeota archaeon]|nr:DUF1616 domain-containing protein [Candidatus Woesearchaeota archaeon]